MSLTTVYQTIYSAWVEGRYENVLQRHKELAALHGEIKTQRSTLIATLCQDLSTSEASASDEVAATLSGIKQLYKDLSFPDTLAREKSIQAGKSAPVNLVPIGPVLIQAAPYCPLSSTILPLAAAIAAGSCCLVSLCDASPSTGEELRRIISTSLDQEAVGIVPAGLALENGELGSMLFGVAVLQDASCSDGVAAELRASNSAVRIHAPSSGLPAIFVDRSVLDLEAVASNILRKVIQCSQNNPGRVPRICFVDEFIINELTQKVQHMMNTVSIPQKHNNSSDSLELQRLTELLEEAFSSPPTTFNSLGPGNNSSLIVVNDEGTVTAETVGMIANTFTSHFHGALLVPTRSMDHGIDIWNKVNDGNSAEATYVFAASKEAFYFSSFLHYNNFLINHIPPHSYGIVAPSSQYNSSELPFCRQDFSINKAILQEPLRHTQGSSAQRTIHSSPKFDKLDLRKIDQPVGGRLSYFEQGLIVGLVSAAVTVSAFSYFAFRGFKVFYTR